VISECDAGAPASLCAALAAAGPSQAVGSQRVLALLAYLLRRLPQCGEFFAQRLQGSEKWPRSSFPMCGPRGAPHARSGDASRFPES